MKEKAVMLTTIDNPYNPFDHWDEWLAYDHWHGYNTNEYLARQCLTCDAFTREEEERQIRETIDDIVKNDPLQIYRKIYEGDTPVPVSLDPVGGV